jgi:hypothetical protein
MHAKQQSVIGKVTGMLLDAVLRTVSEVDPEGAVRAMLARRDRAKTVLGAILLEPGAKEGHGVLFDGLATAFKNAMRSGNSKLARQQLSLAVMVPGIKDAEIIKGFSERSELVAGDAACVVAFGSKVIFPPPSPLCIYFNPKIIPYNLLCFP